MRIDEFPEAAAYLAAIRRADEGARAQCLRRWDAVAKPLHSLGLLETLAARMAAVQRTPVPHATKKRVLVFCADNGVVAEGVSQSGCEVTAAVARALCGGTSNVNIMARVAGADVRVFDVGMANPVSAPGLTVVSCARGTDNLARGPAMTPAQAVLVTPVETAIMVAARVILSNEYGSTSSFGDKVLPMTSLEPADSSSEPLTVLVCCLPSEST